MINQQFCLFTECLDRKGSASGTCAAGFGVCCVFLTSSCGSTVRENCTYIRSEKYITYTLCAHLGSQSLVLVNKSQIFGIAVHFDFRTCIEKNYIHAKFLYMF